MNTIERLHRGIRLFGLVTTLQLALTPLRKAYHTARFADSRPRGPALWPATWRELRRRGPVPPLPPCRAADGRTARPSLPEKRSAHVSRAEYRTPGPVVSHSINGQTVTVACEHAHIHMTVLAPDLLRIEVQRPGEELDRFSYAVAKPDAEWPPVAYSVAESPVCLSVCTERVRCNVNKQDGRVSFQDAQPPTYRVCEDRSPMGWRGHAVVYSMYLPPSAHLYGLGEKAFGLDRRGHVYEMWNTDPNGAYITGTDPIYLSIPFFLVLSHFPYAVFFDNTYHGYIDAAVTDADTMHVRFSGGPLRYYFFSGPDVATILHRYTELTGRMALPPLWALGYHQSRWSYTPDKQVREIANEFRRRRIPCDAIHLDIHYMDGYRCFTWHPQRFPDPTRLVGDLHAQGFTVVPLIDCGIKNDHNYGVCRDGIERGVFCSFPDGSLFRGPVWPGDCYFPDFTGARVREWWKEQCHVILHIGVDGIWNDMNEPTVFGPVADTMPDCVRHDWDGRGANHAQAHNVYGLQMARATAEAMQALRPDRRPFVMTRSGWAGLQRYAMNWMGDNVSSWEHLRLTIPMIINLGLSGLAFTGPDTGGFAGDCEPELLTRWLQLGVFTPFFRNHTALGTAAQEPWVHGEPYESINRRTIELRYHLLPYIYTAFWQCAQTGMPMLRPLFMHWPHDEQAHACEDTFMFGDALLVAPVVEKGATARAVALPDGAWYEWWTGQRYQGKHTITVDAPLARIPFFARAGSMIPAWPAMQYVGERPPDVLTLHIFPGNGQSVLYEDDGESLAYRRGACRVTTWTLQATTGKLTLERQISGDFAPHYTHVELIVHGLDEGDVGQITADGKPIAEWQYDAETRSVRCRARLATVYCIEHS